MYRNEREQLQAECASLTAQLVAVRAATVDAEAELALKRREWRALRWPTWSRYVELVLGWRSVLGWRRPQAPERVVPSAPAETASIEVFRTHNVRLRVELEHAERYRAAVRGVQQVLDRKLSRLRGAAERQVPAGPAVHPRRPGRGWLRTLWRWCLLVPMSLAAGTDEPRASPLEPLPSWRDEAAWDAWWAKHRRTMRLMGIVSLCFIVLGCLSAFLKIKYGINLLD
ncbi:MAG: hypothetical protein IT378_08195 [Sandaracinaceae bacterium]|nr:hypothetical protein [Sandaracinaceae bacterium]